MTRYCAVFGCPHNERNPKYKCGYVQFPKDNDDLLREWVRVTGNAKLKRVDKKTLLTQRHVCDCHFLSDDIFLDQKSKKKTKPLVRPTANLPSPHLFLSEEDVASLPRTLPTIPTISTLEKVPDDIVNDLITNLRNKRSSTAVTNIFEKNKKWRTVTGTTVQNTTSLAQADHSDQVFSIPESTIPSENEATRPSSVEHALSTSSTVVDLNAETNQIAGSALNSIVPTEISITPDTAGSTEAASTHTYTADTSYSSTPRTKKLKKKRNHNLHVFLPEDETIPPQTNHETFTDIQEDPVVNHSMTPVTPRADKSTRRPNSPDSPKSYKRNSAKRVAMSAGVHLTPNGKKKYGQLLVHERKAYEDLKKKFEEITEENKRLKAQQKRFDNISSPLLLRLIEAHLRNKNLPDKQRIWTMEDKLFALYLYRSGSKVYSILYHEDPTCLPSARTVLRLCQMIPFTVGLNPSYFYALGKVVLKMSPEDLLCCLSIDEIGIKPILVYDPYTDRIYGFVNYGELKVEFNKNLIANKALVMMIQGLNSSWKQPLAVYFTSGGADGKTIAELLKMMIIELRKIGLTVKAVVADQASSNCAAIDQLRGIVKEKDKHLKMEKTYFTLDDDVVKRYTLLDPPHGWKRLKENFVGSWKTWFNQSPDRNKYDYPGNEISFGGLVGAYCDIVLLYKLGSVQDCTFLTDAMIFPDTYDAMRVKYALKVMSQTVANFLRSADYLEAKKLRDNNKLIDPKYDTAGVIERLNQLCDVTNGPSSTEDDQPNGRCHVTADSYHHKKWQEMIEYLKNTEFKKWDGKTYKPPTINNMILTMRAMSDLWWDLHENENFKKLNLRRLHQDMLENLFGLLRYAAGSNNNPTAIDLLRSLKCLILSRFSCPVSNSTNCESDDTPFLLQQRDWINCSNEMRKENDVTETENLSADTVSIDSSNNGTNNHDEDNEQQNVETNNTIHIPDYDSGNEDIIDYLYLTADMMPSIVVNQLMKNLKLNSDCTDCFNSFISSSSGAVFEPTIPLRNFIITTEQIFKTEIVQKFELDRPNIVLYSSTKFLEKIKNLEWIKCKSHREDIKERVCRVVACILVRRQIAKMNKKTKNLGHKSKNAAKVAQMADPNDKREFKVFQKN